MSNILFPRDINLNEDELLDNKIVHLTNEWGEVYSTHSIATYLIKQGKFKGEMYYVFTFIDGKSVMNYMPDDYYRLSEFVSISFDYTIFQKYKNDVMLILINPDYRLRTK